MCCTIFGIFSIIHKEEVVWPGGTHPMLFTELSCVCMPSFRPVVPYFFLAKVPFLAFLNTERGVAIYTYLRLSPGD